MRDRAGNIMHTGRFWDPSTKKHTSGDGPGGRSYSALPLDWDADGDYDLLIGTDAGNFYLRVNEGTKSKAAFSTTNQPVLAAGAPAAVSKYAMPVAADWDGDGRWDLISGSYDGSVYWFRNVGEKGQPVLEAPVRLVGSAAGTERGERAQVDVADFDGDGDMDLLVGDHRFTMTGGKYVGSGYVWLFRRRGAPAESAQGVSAGRR